METASSPESPGTGFGKTLEVVLDSHCDLSLEITQELLVSCLKFFAFMPSLAIGAELHLLGCSSEGGAVRSLTLGRGSRGAILQPDPMDDYSGTLS